MKEMLCAEKVSVYCFRTGIPGEAIRRALSAELLGQFSSLLLPQNHPNASIVCSPNAIACAIKGGVAMKWIKIKNKRVWS